MRLSAKIREIRRLGSFLKAARDHFLHLELIVLKKTGRKQFVVHPRSLGFSKGISYNHVEELVEALEGAGHK